MNIIERLKNVSFDNGKFLSDKSYAYDTVYFVTRFIRDYSEDGIFDLTKYKELFNKYIADIFNKDPNNSDIANYYLEVLRLLEYSKTIIRNQRGNYSISDYEMINFICYKMENAYIYLYVLSFHTISNSNLLNLYSQFCYSDDAIEEKNILNSLNIKLSELNPSVSCSPDNQWAKQNTKYIINVLNFYNDKKPITRTLIVDNDVGIRNPESISVNVNGTRTQEGSEKDNDYLKKFDYLYVDKYLSEIKVKKEM